jgi:NCS1 family nucleobase:cation symporter-1
MAIFRYARRAAYGFYSAFGMYLGHYLAWIAAGIMGAAAAVAMQQPLIELDAGGVAFYALGVSGAVAVVIAGWTTSNPTLYRAGLALQVVTPNWPRWLVTLVAGSITTLIACSPFVFTKLLDFVGLYGLLLMPIGAIVIVEHWIFPRIGFTRYWVAGQGRLLNWPALTAWILAILIAMILWQTGVLHLFFLFIPVWFITSILYIAFAAMAGATKSLSAEDEKPVEDVDRENDGTAATESPAGEGLVGGSSSQYPLSVKIAGIIALLALLFTLALPLQVLFMGAEGLTDRVEWIKDILSWLTLVYFISGAVWLYNREKGK